MNNKNHNIFIKRITSITKALIYIIFPMASFNHFKDIINNTQSVRNVTEELGRTIGYICEISGIVMLFQASQHGMIIYFIGRLTHIISIYKTHRAQYKLR